MKRIRQFLLISLSIIGAWFGMQHVHELGHVLGAWLTGGEVKRVVLSPLTISRTDLGQNPFPLVVVWAGPIFGVTFPVVLWLLGCLCRLKEAFLLRFFAGFCLVANGAYIAVGSFDRVGDCGEMLRSGSHLWHLWLFGVLSVLVGLGLWHRQGTHFGLGSANGDVSVRAIYEALFVSVVMLMIGFLVDGK